MAQCGCEGFANHAGEGTGISGVGCGAELMAVRDVPGRAGGEQSVRNDTIPALAGSMVLVIGLLTLAGWWLGIAALKSLVPGAVSMKPNTAVALALAGSSLLMHSFGRPVPALPFCARLLALAVLAIGAANLSQYVTGVNLGMDEFLFVDDPDPVWTPHPGRMAVLTTLALILVGFALATLDGFPRAPVRPVEICGLLVLLLGCVDFFEYLLGIGNFFPGYTHTRMALHTAAAFMLLGAGMLVVRPPSPLVRRLRCEATGTLERRIWMSLALSLAAITVAVMAALLATRDVTARTEDMTRLQGARRAVLLLLSSAQDVEVGMRGFAVTGSTELLEHYMQALRRLDRRVENLAAHFVNDPVNGRRVARVRATVQEQVAGAHRVRDIAATRGIEAAREVVAAGAGGQQWLDALRAMLADLDEIQVRQLGTHVAEQRSSSARLYRVLTVDALLALAFTLIFGLLIHSEVRRRREAEQTLRRSEEHIATVLESITDAVLAVDAGGRITRMNPVAESLTGWRIAEARGRPGCEVFRLVPQNPQGPAPDIIADVLARGTLCELDNQAMLLSRTGTVCPVSAGAAPIRDGAGWLCGAVLTFRDVTLERETGRVLREFNARMDLRVQQRTEELQRYAHIVSSASDMLAFRDLNNRFVLVNEAYCRYFGLSAAEIVGRVPEELFATDEYEQLVRPLGERCLRGESIVAEGWITYPAFGRRYMELRYDPYLDAAGVVQGMVSVARDITDRHESEQRLRSSEIRFKAVAELGSDLMFEAALDSGVVTWFGDVDALLGFRAGIGPRTVGAWIGAVHAEDRERIDNAVRFQMQNPATDFAEEYRMMGADGSEHWWNVRSRLLPAEGGNQPKWVGSVRDVTQQRNMEKQLAQAQKMEAVGQLTGGVAHDFNNRLTTILGSLELLQRQLPDRADSQRLINMAIRAVEGGASLTRQLLTYSRRQVLESRVLNVTGSIHEMVPLFRQTLGEDIEVQFVQHDRAWLIKTDPGLLENALLNLALNARDAMPDGGKLIIETRNVVLEGNYLQDHVYAHAGEHVLVTVSDSGTGIPRAVLSRVLEPFFTTKEPGRGTGLGLSMVYGFMRQSGGHMDVYSEEGHGTSVKLYFPRYAGAVPEAVAPAADGSGRAVASRRILVVEDDASVRQLAATQLRELGYQVIEAESGADAMNRAAEVDNLDLLFTDVIMPGGMTGVDLAARLRRRWQNLEVVFTSGYTQRKVQSQWMEHGARDHWLPKPYSFSTLASIIGTIIRADTAH